MWPAATGMSDGGHSVTAPSGAPMTFAVERKRCSPGRIRAPIRRLPVIAAVCSFLLLTTSTVNAQCARSCSGHGACTSNSVCNCFSGYTGADCSLRACARGPAWSSKSKNSLNAAHAPAECSAAGSCNRVTGQCECFPGFFGEACESSESFPSVTVVCYDHGTCSLS